LAIDLKKYTALKKAVNNRPFWLVASSHPGEEELVLTAHKILKREHPDLLTILVPRHIERASSLQELTKSQNLTAVLQTETMNLEGVDIYISNTLGELATWYALSPVALMGATFVPKGGHNPIEAAQLGTFVLHGPHTFNNSQLYDILSSLGFSEKIQNAKSIATSVRPWLSKPKTGYTEPAILKKYRDEQLARLVALLNPYLALLGATKE